MSREDKFKTLEEIEAKITDLAGHQVSLSKSIEKLRPELEDLEKKKEFLLIDLKEIEERIETKNSERNESLNIRDEQITKKEEELIKKEDDLKSSGKIIDSKFIEFNLKMENINNLMYELNALLSENREKHDGLIKAKNEIENRYQTLRESEKEAREIIESSQNKERFLEEREIRLTEKEISMDNKNEEINARLKLAEEREHKLKDDTDDLEKRINEAAKIDAQLLSRENVLLEKERYHQSMNDQIIIENKKIQLAWLRINKAIQDKQLDIDLGALKK